MGCSLEKLKTYHNTNAFQKVLDESDRKQNEIWVHKDSEFYNINEIMVSR